MKLNSRVLMSILTVYLISILVWDYTRFYQIVLILLFISTLLLYRLNLFKNIQLYPLNYWLLILYFALHTLIGNSVASDISYRYILTLILNLMGIICCTQILNSKKRIHICMKAIIYSALFLCIYATFMDQKNILSGNLGTGVREPFSSVVFLHNSIPMICGFAVFFLIYFKLEKIKFKHSNVIIAVLTLFVILSGARKGLIFILFALVIYPYLFSGKRVNFAVKIIKIVLVFITLFIFYYLLMNNQFLYQVIGIRFDGFLNGVGSGNYSEASAVSRNNMINTGLNLIKIKPWTGYGLATFQTFMGSYDTWSHNNYLELCVSGGIIAPAIYYMFHTYAIFKLSRKYKFDRMGAMFLCILIFILVQDFLSVSYLDRLICFMYSLVSAYLNIQKNNNINSKVKKDLREI